MELTGAGSTKTSSSSIDLGWSSTGGDGLVQVVVALKDYESATTTSTTSTSTSSSSSSTSTSTTTTVGQGDVINYSSVSGTGVGNYRWISTLANVGLDQVEIDNEASLASVQNANLSIPFEQEVNPNTLSKTISAITVYCYIKADVQNNSASVRILTHDYWFPQEYPYDMQRVGTSYSWISKTFVVNPYTGNSWTWAEFNQLRAGCITVSLGNFVCDKVYVSVTIY